MALNNLASIFPLASARESPAKAMYSSMSCSYPSASVNRLRNGVGPYRKRDFKSTVLT